jgi:hypothetical protein
MKTRESKNCLLFAYHFTTTTILQKLPSYNNYHHAIGIIPQKLVSCNSYRPAHIAICRLKRRPPTTYKSLIIVAYRL